MEGQCVGLQVCPLSHITPDTVARVMQVLATPEVTDRLRELGFCYRQKIKLIARQSSFICQVCNARLGISQALADSILVEPIPASLAAL